MVAHRGENWILPALAGLFGLFVLGALYSYERASELVPGTARSSLNPLPAGAKAFYLLCQRLGFRCDRLEADWHSLSTRDGLVVVLEPYADDRLPAGPEITALKHWIEAGGSLAYGVASPTRRTDPPDPLTGDIEIIAAPNNQTRLPVGPSGSGLLRDVHLVTVRAPVRMVLPAGSPYTSLIQDRWGAIVVSRQLGIGSLIVFADDRLTANAGIAEADNAILMSNIVEASVMRTGRIVLFDEYHHGAGMSVGAERLNAATLWSSVPAPLRLVTFYFGLIAALGTCNANCRFGPVKTSMATDRRSKADFVRSMAHLLRRAGAGDLAIDTRYRVFRSELVNRLRLPSGSDTTSIVEHASRLFAQDLTDLGTLMVCCDEVTAGRRLTDDDTLRLAAEIERWQRRLDRVGV